MTQTDYYLDGHHSKKHSHRECYLEVGNAIADIVERENLPSEELDDLIFQCFTQTKSFVNHSRQMNPENWNTKTKSWNTKFV